MFSCITVIAILASGCSGEKNGGIAEAPLPPGSEITQSASHPPDNSLSGTNSQNISDMSSDLSDDIDIISDNPEIPNSAEASNTQQANPQEEPKSPVPQPNKNAATEEKTVKKMNLQIGNNSFTATLESNAAADALADMMCKVPVVVQMSDYSGFEKVGSLGVNLPASNRQTTTQSGDIVLYNGNQIVIFYGSNSWSYTRLGKIDDLSGWEDALGSGDITVTFSLQ